MATGMARMSSALRVYFAWDRFVSSSMVVCSAVNCKNRPRKESGKTFHRFPAQKTAEGRTLCDKWLANLNRPGWAPTKYSVLCSDHFEEKWFDRMESKTLLRPGAVPTIFLSTDKSESIPESLPDAASSSYISEEPQLVHADALNASLGKVFPPALDPGPSDDAGAECCSALNIYSDTSLTKHYH